MQQWNSYRIQSLPSKGTQSDCFGRDSSARCRNWATWGSNANRPTSKSQMTIVIPFLLLFFTFPWMFWLKYLPIVLLHMIEIQSLTPPKLLYLSLMFVALRDQLRCQPLDCGPGSNPNQRDCAMGTLCNVKWKHTLRCVEVVETPLPALYWS